MIKDNDNDVDVNQLRLQAVLAEYNSLKNELLQKFRHQLQIYYYMFASIGFLLYVIKEMGNYDVILFIPYICAAFAFRYMWEQYIINRIGDYLRKIEDEKLTRIIGYRNNCPKNTDNTSKIIRTTIKKSQLKSDMYWVGWEHYFMENWPKSKFLTLDFYKCTILVIFISPIFIGLMYNILAILQRINSIIPIEIHVVAGAINLILILYLFRKLNRPE